MAKPPVLREGSSPHTRGALKKMLDQPVRVGIIPAYAGSTFPKTYEHALHGDHPRIRGEHLIGTLAPELAAGSSPHTRGARNLVVPNVNRHGIIPAYAGSTPSMLPLRPTMRDHPRIRGEHLAWQRN